ncbi:MAG: endo-beta-N-acetylglucosaminidase [Brevibacterium sp.]
MTSLSRRTLLRVGAAGAGAAALGAHASLSPAHAETDSDLGSSGPFTAPTMTPAEPGFPEGPLSRGFLIDDLADWTPETVEYAENFRSAVPLRDRIPHDPESQAHRDLSADTQYLALEIDYDGSSYQPRAQIDGAEGYVWTQRFWPYYDVWGSWHGQVVDGGSYDDGPAGLIDLPNPGFVEMGHLHGAKVIGGWFWPREGDFGPYVEQREDGSFPVADAMIAMRRYFGFDGFFINQEKEITAREAEQLAAMLRYIRAEDPEHYLCYYDAVLPDGELDYQNRLNEKNLPWLGTPEDRLADSIFLNYDWPKADPGLAGSADAVRAAGFDPLQVGFAGVEHQKGGFDPRERFGDLAHPGTEAPLSMGNFVSQSFWSDAGDDALTVEGRRRFRTLEQEFFSGPSGNPATSGRVIDPTPDGRTDVLNPERYDGVAHMIVEKSTLDSLPIRTTFGVGVGSHFRIHGRVVSTRPWNNAGIGQLNPTWQYWTEPELPLGEVHLDETIAWEGSHSLGVDSDATDVELHLFKTALSLPRQSFASARIRSSEAVTATMVLTHDDGSRSEVVLHRGRPDEGDWAQHRGPIPARAARRPITRVSLSLSSTAPLSVNVGEVLLVEAPEIIQPTTPAGFTAEVASSQGDARAMQFGWEQQEAAEFWDLFHIGATTRTWLGRTRRDRLYVHAVPSGGSVELVATSADGSRSDTASIEV